MLARLDLLAPVPARVVDLGCGTGALLPQLRQRYPRAKITGIDVSRGMLAQVGKRAGRWRRASLVQADAHVLPLADDSVDLLVSSLLLPWCDDQHRIIQEIFRVLTPGGTVLFTSAGPDTLIEYRRLWQTVDTYDHVFGLVDMHDLGDSMQSAGFSAPVLDREVLRVDYPSVDALEKELRHLGASNIASQRRRGLMASSTQRRLAEAQAASDGVNNRFMVTLELIQGHAWKPEAPLGKQGESGEFMISMDRFRAGLRKKNT